MQGVICILALAYITYYVLVLVKAESVRILVIVLGIVLAFAIVWVYAGHGVVVR